jgi:autotransporter-associated beta strand protein
LVVDNGTGNGSRYLALSGANTYSEGTTLLNNVYMNVYSDGALGTGSLTFSGTNASLRAANNITLANAIVLNNTATVDFMNSATDMTLNGQITGSGGLLKTNSASLTLGGANSYSGGTTIAAGTLIGTTASLQGAITNNGALTFNQASSGTYGGVISGTGTLSKTNTGSVTLSATNSYSGATTVSQGTLLVDTTGSIASSSATVNGGLLNVNGTAGAVTVNMGGSLGGSGTVGELSLNNGGSLNPGNSPGTLTAAQAIVMGGSTYNWQISNSGAGTTAGTDWDLFSVGGLLNMSNVTDANKWNLVVTADGAFTGWTDSNSPYEYIFAQAANLSLSAGFSTDVGTDVTSLFNITASGMTSLPNSSYNANGDFKVFVGSVTDANGGSITTLNLMAVPEPSTGSMLGLGLAGLVVTRLLRRKTS